MSTIVPSFLKSKSTRFLPFLVLVFLILSHSMKGQIGIGTSTPNASSIIDITSTTKGLLIPRMTFEQRSNIGSPATGLMVYQTNFNFPSIPGFYFYDGSAWKRFARSDEVGGNNSWTISAGNQYSSVPGNVGIGTSTPASKFHLVGNMVQDNGTITLNHTGSIIQFQNDGVNRAFLQLSGNNLRIGTNSSNTGAKFIIRMNANDRLTIDSVGSLGLGTTLPHPSAKLDVASTTRGILLPRLTTTQMFAIDDPPNGLLVYNTNYNQFVHHDGTGWQPINNNKFWSRPATNRQRITNAVDSVGIGNSGPQARLHITNGSHANLTTHNGHIMLGNASGLNMAIGHYEILARNNGEAGNLFLQQDGGLVRIGSGGFAIGAKLQITDGTFASLTQHGELVLGEVTGQNIVMDINEIQARNAGAAAPLLLNRSGGNVGIGTNVPGSKLDVIGRLRVLQNNEAIAMDGVNPYLGFWYNGSYRSKIQQLTDQLYIHSNNKVHLDGDQVAIGDMLSTANGYLLTVTGKVICEELKVRLAGNWPDYVFADTYVLRPLDELKSFIQTHHHLPNIPKAGEVETEGFEVGEMNRKLLEKVEELTLYIIDLQEQIDALKSKY